MSDKQNPEEFYADLKVQLEEKLEWPNDYLYKFIVPSSNQKIAEIEEIFDGLNAKINSKVSSKGNYTSVSIYVRMETSEAVIAKYREVGEKVEGVISL